MDFRAQFRTEGLVQSATRQELMIMQKAPPAPSTAEVCLNMVLTVMNGLTHPWRALPDFP